MEKIIVGIALMIVVLIIVIVMVANTSKKDNIRLRVITSKKIELLLDLLISLKNELEKIKDQVKQKENKGDSFENLEYMKLSKDATVPKVGQHGDAGYDLYNAETKVIQPKERTIVKTDIAINLKHGYFAMITSRSSVSLKTGLTVHTGIIDSNYPHGLGIIVENTTDEPVEVKQGERLAQMLIIKCETPTITRVTSFDDKKESKTGFGSSGK